MHTTYLHTWIYLHAWRYAIVPYNGKSFIAGCAARNDSVRACATTARGIRALNKWHRATLPIFKTWVRKLSGSVQRHTIGDAVVPLHHPIRTKVAFGARKSSLGTLTYSYPRQAAFWNISFSRSVHIDLCDGLFVVVIINRISHHLKPQGIGRLCDDLRSGEVRHGRQRHW